MSTWIVVEDEADVYDTLLALFAIWSIDGIAFTNGNDAIKWIESVDAGQEDVRRPELALLDIRLPGASGPEIGARLRQSPVLKDITIVLNTAYYASPSEEKEMMEQAQADAWIAKPLPSPREFRAALQRAIDQRRLAAEAKPSAAADEPTAPPPPAESTPPEKTPSPTQRFARFRAEAHKRPPRR